MPAEPEIVLDLSRLLSRVLHTTPTGVDRCEMAWARGLLAKVPDRVRFAAVHPAGVYGRLPRGEVARFLDATEARWEHGTHVSRWDTRRFATQSLLSLRPQMLPGAARQPRVYLQASPNNLVRPRLVGNILRRERARFVCLVHDLIPLQYPEYARPDGAWLHARRVATVVDHADGIVTNSQATLEALQPYIARSGRVPATIVAHLGATRGHAPPPPAAAETRPYFVTIGTIEPRKNHLLLLNLWRRMAEQRGAAACPRLVVIGRRGWENEQVVDMLERCPHLSGCVEERNGMPDAAVQATLLGARALLLPSFAEGYGMPVSEALARGVPVICSDLPALREAGGDVPDYLDPLDGPAWAEAIAAFSGNSPRVARQRALLPDWPVPTWEAHMDRVMALVDTLS